MVAHHFITSKATAGISLNVPGICEVPSGTRNLDGTLAKSDMHLLSEPVRGKVAKQSQSAQARSLNLFVILSFDIFNNLLFYLNPFACHHKMNFFSNLTCMVSASFQITSNHHIMCTTCDILWVFHHVS